MTDCTVNGAKVTVLKSEGSCEVGSEVVKVTTIIDIEKKEVVAETETGGKIAMAGGTRKGLGTTYFNTRMTSGPTISDADTLKESS